MQMLEIDAYLWKAHNDKNNFLESWGSFFTDVDKFP